MIAPLVEQFPPAVDPPAEARPVADEAQPVDTPPVELDETPRLLAASQAHNAELLAENAALRAMVATHSAPKAKWLALKTFASRRNLTYETARRMCIANRLTARRDGSRWMILDV